MIAVILLLLILAAVVASLLLYFGDWKTYPWYVQFTCFVGWLFPFSIILILPLDLASNLHRECLRQGGPDECVEPVAYVPESFLWVFWQIVYWNMFCLTWFVVPIMQSYVRSGDFTAWLKFVNAIKDNLIYYAIVGVLGAAFLVYMLVAIKFQKQVTSEDLVAFLMAGANAWGLLLCTCMLGYGCVEIPRGLWRQASTAGTLFELEKGALKAKEAMVDSEAQMYEVAREVAVVARRVDIGDPLRKHVDLLIYKCPQALEERTSADDDEDPSPPNYDRLRTIHSKIIYYAKVNQRHQAQFRFLVHRASFLYDIMENEKSKERKFRSKLVKPGPPRFEDLRLTALWWWYIYLRPLTLRSASILCALASLALVWSESTFQVTSVPLSVPAWMLKTSYITNEALEIVSMSFLLYMCTCAYSTLFKVKIFDYYVLVPEHHTDEASLLFISAYLCRLTFPLCYNFLNMVSDDENSVFVQYQGKFIDLAPLLGAGFNTWVPELVLIFALLTLFNLYERILTALRIRKFFFDEAPASEADAVEGRQIILQARSAEERKTIRGAYIESSGAGHASAMERGGRVGGGGGGGGGAGSKPPTRATNTKDLLAKYKQAGGRSATGGHAPPPQQSAASTTATQAAKASGGGLFAAFANPFSFERKGTAGAAAGSAKTTPPPPTSSSSSSAGGGGGPRGVGGGAGKYQRLQDDGEEEVIAVSVESQLGGAGCGGTGRKFGRTLEDESPPPPARTGPAIARTASTAGDIVLQLGEATRDGGGGGGKRGRGRRNVFDGL
ncbi:LMBR1-like membrane protein-domain-containing protein [Zopfochytrium polystomum]|nr:LMBR1-like membrane protein-domain-containing protein [Zopfochytrium polystomum]